MKSAALLIAVLSTFGVSALANADPIHITVKTNRGVGKKVPINWMEGGEKRTRQTDVNGRLDLVLDCNSVGEFWLEPDDVYGEIRPDKIQPCSGTVNFQIVQSAQMTVLDSLVFDLDGNVGQNVQFAASAVDTPFVALQLARLKDANARLDFAEIARSANELAALARRNDAADEGQLLSAIAYESGSAATAQVLGKRVDKPFVVQSQNGAWEESQAAHDLLLEFKRENGLKGETWDGKTFEVLDRLHNRE